MKKQLTRKKNTACDLHSFEAFIGKPEVARRIHKTPRTVESWMARGLLPYYKIGRSVCFKWSEVEAHLKKTCRVCRKDGGN